MVKLLSYLLVMSNVNIVYGLYSTRDNVVRYIGQTSKRMWERFSEHLQEAANGVTSEKANWLRAELNAGFHVHAITLLEDARRNVDERRMLDVYELSGHYLTNTHGTEAHRDAQREGIERAKAEGKYKGRPQSIDREPILKLRAEGVSPTEISRRLRIGRATVYRAIDEVDRTAALLVEKSS